MKNGVLHSYKKVFEKLFGKSEGFQKPTINMGDFNINSVDSTSLVEYVKERCQLRQLVVNLLQNNIRSNVYKYLQ